jgi:hypothetical protein
MEEMGAVPEKVDQIEFDTNLALARFRLDPNIWKAEWEYGQGISREVVIREALRRAPGT